MAHPRYLFDTNIVTAHRLAALMNTTCFPKTPPRAARCFGTDREQMLGGGVKESCDHRPLTREEGAARSRARLAQVEKMRAHLRLPTPKLKVVKPKDLGQKLQCSKCGRKDNTLGGLWQPGDACNWPTGALNSDGSLATCAGHMEMANDEGKREERQSNCA